MTLVDHHCHLDFPDFADELDGVIARAKTAGVGLMVTISHRMQHARVGQRSGDIELRKPLVEIDRRGIALHEFRDRFAEPARPGFAHIAFLVSSVPLARTRTTPMKNWMCRWTKSYG